MKRLGSISKCELRPLLIGGIWDGVSYIMRNGYAGDDLEPRQLNGLRSRVKGGEFGNVWTVRLPAGVTFAKANKGIVAREFEYLYEDLHPVSITAEQKARLFAFADEIGIPIIKGQHAGSLPKNSDTRSFYGPNPVAAIYAHLLRTAAQQARASGRDAVITCDLKLAEYDVVQSLLNSILPSAKRR